MVIVGAILLLCAVPLDPVPDTVGPPTEEQIAYLFRGRFFRNYHVIDISKPRWVPERGYYEMEVRSVCVTSVLVRKLNVPPQRFWFVEFNRDICRFTNDPRWETRYGLFETEGMFCRAIPLERILPILTKGF